MIDLSITNNTATNPASSESSNVAIVSSTNNPLTAVSVTNNDAQVDSMNVNDDHTEDSIIPPFRREYEKAMHQNLKVLYTEPFKFAYREVTVGGKAYQLDCFHYVDSTNSSQPEFNNKAKKKFEFVNRQGENATVYRWEIKMAIITQLRQHDNKYADRVFFSFARYGSTSCKKMYDCCAVMTIRCVNRIPVFLMLEVGSDGSTISEEVQSWEGYDRIKHFYVMPEVPVDYDKLSRARLKYWDMNRHLYDEARLIQIDTHRPGDMTVERATTQQMESSWKMWTIKHGPRDIFAEAKVPVVERSTPREVQMRENKELKVAKTELTSKSKTILDLEKLVTKLQTQLKEGKTAPPAASNKRNFQALQDVGEAPAASKKRVTASSSSSVGCDISPTVLQMLPASSSYSHESRFSNQSPATFIMQQHASPIVMEMRQELNKSEIEVSIQQKKIQTLELQMVAAQKQAALNNLNNEQTLAKARHNLELSGIHLDQREMQQAARSRQNYINDEDRAFQKEAIRRQWSVEDRAVTANKLLDFASKAHELPMLQTLLASQSTNTTLATMHPVMRPQVNTSYFASSPAHHAVGSSSMPTPVTPARNLMTAQQYSSLFQQPPMTPAAAALAATASAAAQSVGYPVLVNDEQVTVDEGGEDFSQYEAADLAARLQQIQSQLAEEYAKQQGYN